MFFSRQFLFPRVKMPRPFGAEKTSLLNMCHVAEIRDIMSHILEEEIVEEELDIEKKYNFPKEIVIRQVDNLFLVIYTEGCTWLVLNEEEINIFKKLQSGISIGQVLTEENEDSVLNVITQIEAKKLETPVVRENRDLNMYIYLTNNCNQRCRHCYMYAGEIAIQELSVDEWKKVIWDFKNCGGHGITFSGGEVTVYQGFDDLIKYAHELGIYVEVLSNGILWSEERVRSLSGCIDEIQISLDGYDRESYYEIRQFDGFEKALETVKLFSGTKTRVAISVTPLYDNLEEFTEKFESFALDFMKKYPSVFIKISLELLDGRKIRSTEKLNNNYKDILKKMVEKLYPDFYAETFVLNYQENNKKHNCGFGEISIASNGDVYWCNRIHELKSSINVKEMSFPDILKKSSYIKEITDVNHSEVCQKCDVKYICGGGCRIKYPDIRNAGEYLVTWKNTCPAGYKENLYRKMIASNEYFYTF